MALEKKRKKKLGLGLGGGSQTLQALVKQKNKTPNEVVLLSNLQDELHL